MIKVTFLMNREKHSASLKIQGHAGAAEKGQDIICASASILAYTLAQNINFEYRRGNLKAKPMIKLEEGDTTVSCKAKDDECFAGILHAFLVIQTGYFLLEHNYPDFVSVKKLSDNEAKA